MAVINLIPNVRVSVHPFTFFGQFC